ncbi:MAG: glutamate--tRNA ligase, partial [Patescibacteria group bacterium]|nr:glutamate--tRNA ligase [Patescibacteria group bacterium]
QKLLKEGLAYPDPYTEEELSAFREKAEKEKKPFLFRNHRPVAFKEWDGKVPLRFKVPVVKRYAWEDAVRGNLEAGEEALDDFVLLKADGYPTYNFAHIIDDHEMGVTHVFRGDEFISSTPRFLSVYEALDFERPVFATTPPILRGDRTKKLGKRDGAKDILEYREEGYLPEAMMNFLALIGWHPGNDQELFTEQELLIAFSLDQIQKSGGAFDEAKLRWFNREHILRLSAERFISYAKDFLSEQTTRALSQAGVFESLVPLMRERIQTFGELRDMDAAGEFSFYAEAPEYDATGLLYKGDPDPKATAERLKKLYVILQNVPESQWHDKTIKDLVWPLTEKEGRGEVLWPFRYALSGKEKSPDPFTIAGIIGKNETHHRLEKAVSVLT